MGELKSVGWSRLATVGRKVNSADRTSTPPRHLPPLSDKRYPPRSVPLVIEAIEQGPDRD